MSRTAIRLRKIHFCPTAIFCPRRLFRSHTFSYAHAVVIFTNDLEPESTLEALALIHVLDVTTHKYTTFIGAASKPQYTCGSARLRDTPLRSCATPGRGTRGATKTFFVPYGGMSLLSTVYLSVCHAGKVGWLVGEEEQSWEPMKNRPHTNRKISFFPFHAHTHAGPEFISSREKNAPEEMSTALVNSRLLLTYSIQIT